MKFETIRAAAVAVKNAILRGFNNRKIFLNRRRDDIFVGNVISGEPPFETEEIADVSEFLEETETFCDNTPYSPPALEYLFRFPADEAPEFFVELLRELLEETGVEIDDV